MATPLRNRLNDLATAFASGVLEAIRGISLDELLSETSKGGGRPTSLVREASTRLAARALPAAAPSGAPRSLGRGGRLARRSADDIGRVIEAIVTLLKQSPRGLRAEQIRTRLGLQAKEMPRPLKEALASGRLGKSGQKRSTTYFAKGAGSPAKAAAPAGEKAKGGKRGKKASAKRGARRAGKAAAPKRGRSTRRGARKSVARVGRKARAGRAGKRGKPAKLAKPAGKKAAPPAAS